MQLTVLLCVGILLAGLGDANPTSGRKVRSGKLPRAPGTRKVIFSNDIELTISGSSGERAVNMKKMKNDKMESHLRKVNRNMTGYVRQGQKECMVINDIMSCHDEELPEGDLVDLIVDVGQMRRSVAETARNKRSATGHHNLEVCLATDVAWFEKVQSLHPVGSATTALETAEILLFALMNGVNLLFTDIDDMPYTIDIVLTDYVIATTKQESLWSQQVFQEGYLEGIMTLRKLPQWVRNNLDTTKCDAVVALTGLNLVGLFEGQVFPGVIGIVFSASEPCMDYHTPLSPVTIVEAILQTTFIIGHELGHLLTAIHDTGDCLSPLRVMSAFFHTEGYGWSSCSKDQIGDFLATDRASCLHDDSFDPDELCDRRGLNFIGNELSTAEQCRLYFDTITDDHCIVTPEDLGEAVCNEFIGCDTGYACFAMEVEDGTPCGDSIDNKRCFKRACVDESLVDYQHCA